MRLREWRRPYGLRAKFAINLVLSGLLCIVLFFCLYFAAEAVLANYFSQAKVEEKYIQSMGESLQEYIDEQQITRARLNELEGWEKKKPVILLELYAGEDCIYSSYYDGSVSTENIIRENNPNRTVTVRLGQETVTAVLYSDFSYQYYLLGRVLSFVIVMMVFVGLFLRSNRQLIKYICKLNDEIQILEGGNLEYQVSVQGNDEITDLAKSMNRMSESFRAIIETEQSLHNAQRRLITQMSHDLRTPLTGMMLYLEILRTHRYETEEQLQGFLEKIDAKAHHMKQLSDHLFEYTLEGTVSEQKEPMGMEQAFSEAVTFLCDDLEARGFTVNAHLTWVPCFVQIKREYIDRIFENIISNMTKYANPEADIIIETVSTEKHCGLSILDTCLPVSDGIETNGVGLESIRAMMEQMDGVISVEETESVFAMTLLFPKR